MWLHHDKHHKSYVDGLNKAEMMMEKARKSEDFELITHWEREAVFNGAKDFGIFSGFIKHFSAAAEKAGAVGLAILTWAPRSNRLKILQSEKNQNLSQWDMILHCSNFH